MAWNSLYEVAAIWDNDTTTIWSEHRRRIDAINSLKGTRESYLRVPEAYDSALVRLEVRHTSVYYSLAV